MLRPFRILLTGLAVLLMACSSAHAADLKYLPDDTEIIITLNFRQILDSALVKGQKDAVNKIKAMLDNVMGDYEEAQKYIKTTGFDLFRDLTCVTLALPGRQDPDGGFVIVEGNFNPKKFHEAADDAFKEHGDVLQITQAGQHKIVEVSPPNGKLAIVVMLNKNTILVCASKDRMTAALARAKTGQANLKKEVKSLLESTNAQQSINAVATGAALAKIMEKAPVPNAQNAGSAVQGIAGLSGALTIAKDIQFQLGITTQDANVAKDLVQKANVLIFVGKGLVAQKAKEDPNFLPLVDVMNTLRASAQGSSVLLRGEATLSNIEKLLKMIPKSQ